jgi:hypothetical protein
MIHPKYLNFTPFNTQNNQQPVHYAFEKFPSEKIKILQEYFIDTLDDDNFENNFDKIWFQETLKKIDFILNDPKKEYVISPTHVYTRVFYEQINKKAIVGRLYSKSISSIQNFSREIRGYLFENENYIDFDMVNAHPTLLLEYKFKNIPELKTPVLEKYVYDTDCLLKEKALKDITDTSVSKEKLLIVLNTNESHARTLGVFSLQLYHEVRQIRDFLYKHLYVKGSEIYKYYQDNDSFRRKDSESKKISVQSIYLQSVETDYVYGLIVFLFDVIQKQVNAEKKKRKSYKTKR